jgi:hypothetical protein
MGAWALAGTPFAAGAHAPLAEQIEVASDRIAAAPGSARLYLERGEMYRAQGDFSLAEADYARAADLDPLLPETDLCRSALCLDSGRSVEAASHLMGYLERVRSIGAAAVTEAKALVQRGEIRGALRLLRESPRAGSDAAPRRNGARATLVRGPYLQSATTSSVVVRWRTDVATDSRVWFGPSPDSLSGMAVNPSVTTEHEVKLTNLAAGTPYVYAVGDETGILAGGDAQYTFPTAPPSGEARPTRLWVIGDSGTGGPNPERVRNAYLAYTAGHRADVWLMLGDNAYPSGTDAEYQAKFFEVYPMILRNTVVWPTRGNHDFLYDGPNNDYYDIVTLPRFGEAGGFTSASEAFYSYDWGDIHFVCLDSEGSLRGPTDPMLNWLSMDLAEANETWTIAFWHHPPYSKGSHDSDDPADSGGRMIDMRENALPILEAGGVDLVLCGHSHAYERSFLLDGHYGYSWTIAQDMVVDGGDGRMNGDGAYRKPTAGPAPNEGTVYAVVGSSAQVGDGELNHPAMFVSLAMLGSLIVDIDGLQLDAVFIDDHGISRDYFTMVKGGPAETPDLGSSAAPAGAGGSPNPFTHRTRIRVPLLGPATVSLSIIDAEGRVVAGLLDRAQLGPGDHEIIWEGLDDRGRPVAAGVYQRILEIDGARSAARLVLVR